ncbi:hypothetical protein [Streptosporangium sp. 'caverna']|uniref:hypothetical protein n=1 Tax=Streptosporangium sp. 'caverna' TaxID=2202249 RepID=UPI001EF769A3|nr:hypothetical protein [Streptosporangium sp. 'caverna']
MADRLRATTRSIEGALFDVIVQAQASGRLSDGRGAADLARFLVTIMQGLRVMGAIDPDRKALMASVEVALTCFDRARVRGPPCHKITKVRSGVLGSSA